jgi:hypothetical protein
MEVYKLMDGDTFPKFKASPEVNKLSVVYCRLTYRNADLFAT